MKATHSLTRMLSQAFRGAVAVLCVALIALADPGAAQQGPPPEEAPKISNDQLDSLVAPIALYPDPLLAQVLAASTYPLEIVQLQQFLNKHPDLKDQALVDAVSKQDWDPTVQALAPLPEVVKRLADDIQWTTDLGNAFLAQESDVMDAVQRMRKKAEDKGALKSDDKMQVKTETVENKEIIVIEQSNPEVVYVPSYDPTIVYGAPVYPYPPIYYPPAGYYAGGLFLSFGIGVAMGAAWSGGWCCGASWGGGNNNININNENNFVRNSNRERGNNAGNRTGGNAGNRTGGGRSNWQHNPQHRGGAPYSNRATADKYGGRTRGEQPGVSNRAGAGAQTRPGGGQAGTGAQTRPGGGQASSGAQTRPGGGNADRGDRVGNQDVSRGGGGGRDAFEGGKGGYNGRDAGRSSNRGSSSMGGRGGGSRGGTTRPSGGRSGGGGRGGGRR